MRKKVCILSAFLIIIVISVFGVYSSFDTKTINKIYMDYSSEVSLNNKKIINQFTYFQRNGNIELYEYTDSISFNDTLVNYYFSGGFNDNLQKKFDKTLTELLTNVGDCEELCYTFYYYSYVLDKYNFNPSDLFVESLYNFENKFNSSFVSSSDKTIAFTSAWRMNNVFNILDITPKTDFMEKAYNNLLSSDDETISRICNQSIISAYTGNDNLMDSIILELVDENKKTDNVDMNTLIIILSNFPDSNLNKVDDKLIFDIFNYCRKNYYYLPLYINFSTFRIVEYLGVDNENVISNFYKNKPKNKDNYSPSVAYIIPSYQRIFKYREICKLLGIQIDNACIYELVNQIEDSKISSDDYYFKSLLSKKMADIDMRSNKKQIENLIQKASYTEITSGNFFNFFYLVKTAMLNNIECKDIIKKILDFKNTQNYLIVDICKEEIRKLNNPFKVFSDDFESKILIYDGESPIDVYYYYFVYLETINKKPSERVKEKVLLAIDDFYVENDQGAGYFRNEEFKYIDINMTYQCLYIEYICNK